LWLDAVTSRRQHPDALRGLDGPVREEREELVRWLLDEDFGAGQIADAMSPMLLPTNRVLGDDGTLVSAQSVAESARVPVELVLRLHRAIGLADSGDPHSAVYPRADAEAVIPATSLIGLGIDAEQVALTVRLLVQGLTDAAMSMRYGGLKTILNPGTREIDLAKALERLAVEAKPFIEAMINEIAALTLRRSFETEAITLSERSAGHLPGGRSVVIAFADIVGFTQLAEDLPLEALGRIVDDLVDITHDVVTEPVRFVKSIGDAVMLVSPDAAKLMGVVVDLLESAAHRDLRLRAGIASGLAMSRAGDWYGSPVNIASRITDIAPPGEAWVAESAAVAAGQTSDVTLAFVALRKLRGVRDATRLFRATRCEGSPD
jgi:adenylate cyclase